jgi:glyoxylase-like metal-dependent hydrolase (beta-lactamase superfamily II)
VRHFREIAPGVLVATADFAMTNSVAVVSGRDCVLIDPGVSPGEIAGLAADLASAGLRVRAGFATHPHWDHVLWSRELGNVPRYAAPAAVRATETSRDLMLDQLQEWAPGHDLDLVGRLTPLPGDAERIPWDGPAAQVLVHNGHAPGHAAVFLPESGVLVAGDMLSDTEIPLLDTAASDLLGDYRAGLGLLSAVSAVRWLVPGHGHVTDASGFMRRAEADARYLDLLEAGLPFEDVRCTQDWLRAAHQEQFRRVSGRPAS